MKISSLFTIALFAAFTLVTACKNKADETSNQPISAPVDSSGIFNAQNTSEPAPTNPNEPHWKCPKNCAGSGGAAQGKCPVCGSDYVHNAAYHGTPPAAGSSPSDPIKINPENSTATPAQTPPPATASAQNAKGVFHYTCSKGCAGGAASAGNCAKCGNALTHNAAFHQ